MKRTQKLCGWANHVGMVPLHSMNTGKLRALQHIQDANGGSNPTPGLASASYPIKVKNFQNAHKHIICASSTVCIRCTGECTFLSSFHSTATPKC